MNYFLCGKASDLRDSAGESSTVVSNKENFSSSITGSGKILYKRGKQQLHLIRLSQFIVGYLKKLMRQFQKC